MNYMNMKFSYRYQHEKTQNLTILKTRLVLNLFGSMRLSSIIHELRKYGAIIETEPVKNQNGSLHAKYYVKSENMGALRNSMIFLKHPSVQVRSYV